VVSEEIVADLKDGGVNLITTVPCEKVRALSNLIYSNFRCIALTREEEGVGICAGASLAGAKPAMLVQSSGIGNMINALCSLTKAYRLPLLILVSWRGVYKERIPTHIPLGQTLPRILAAIDVDYKIVKSGSDLRALSDIIAETYRTPKIQAILLNPGIWQGEKATEKDIELKSKKTVSGIESRLSATRLTRYEILKTVAPFLDGKIVVCNLGIPCKELYQVKHQKSNFYMLGSMGLASSIGLGIALFTKKDVIVIDGDGSLLMNLGSLSTIAVNKPKNLTILVIDNGVHGSTGNQPTGTSFGVDLELIAKGSGFKSTFKAASEHEITSAVQNLKAGPKFVHILARSGNADVPNVPLALAEIKRNIMEAIRE
jgi:phosphonopyruvate decarboxylase